ncbi:SpoU rRNA methylase family protein [Roseivirga ehrenbergii]|uniref:RNA methyltransferase n=1 Tax=Roseivirga ehrenbergii (strain DSM 102268 / JCM 13514 / KCTC 12282 / NCIMB 14502 / KMM 6017) TaxID=279360 RepID=A0A150XSZ5_ROSEK|nr:RNA methyltransferase [Roseivirga ehrenbergii]KYG81722.1 RNA methyltransferase [Roseivirga ehrenbergii]TCL10900.1 SpoU rRNA methylase family protein [Roseivirga ehrenbergii]
MRKLKNDELDRLTLEEFKTTEKLPLVLILDNVRSMNNVGSAFRTSDAFAVEKIYLCGITAQPPHREINKTALGATESVDWEHAENTATLCKDLQQQGYKVLAVEQADNSTSLENFKIEEGQKYALVFGNEVFGVEDEVIEVADGCLEIPQFGTKHSLNISVSIGVVLWDLTRKIKFG